jgi:hypothetical protein
MYVTSNANIVPSTEIRVGDKSPCTILPFTIAVLLPEEAQHFGRHAFIYDLRHVSVIVRYSHSNINGKNSEEPLLFHLRCDST